MPGHNADTTTNQPTTRKRGRRGRPAKVLQLPPHLAHVRQSSALHRAVVRAAEALADRQDLVDASPEGEEALWRFAAASAGDTVTYELDSSDEHFLASLNAVLNHPALAATGPNRPLTEDRLELMIDLLEKASFWRRTPTLAAFTPHASLTRDRGAVDRGDESMCTVCAGGMVGEDDPIVSCTRCTVAVHASCGGIRDVPAVLWLCARCVAKDPVNVQCLLCPVTDGLFAIANNESGTLEKLRKALTTSADADEQTRRRRKRTNPFGRTRFNLRATETTYVHVLCARFAPGSTVEPFDQDSFGGEQYGLAVDAIIAAARDGDGRACSLCFSSSGLVSHCSAAGCEQHMHVSCAREAGLLVVCSGQPKPSPSSGPRKTKPVPAVVAERAGAPQAGVLPNLNVRSVVANGPPKGSDDGLSRSPVYDDGLPHLETYCRTHTLQYELAALYREHMGELPSEADAAAARAVTAPAPTTATMPAPTTTSSSSSSSSSSAASPGAEFVRRLSESSALPTIARALELRGGARLGAVHPVVLYMVLRYWESRRARINKRRPLLKQLRTVAPLSAMNTLTAGEYAVRFCQLRQEFEKVRMLCDLLLKRELLKKEIVSVDLKELDRLEELAHAANGKVGPPRTLSLLAGKGKGKAGTAGAPPTRSRGGRPADARHSRASRSVRGRGGRGSRVAFGTRRRTRAADDEDEDGEESEGRDESDDAEEGEVLESSDESDSVIDDDDEDVGDMDESDEEEEEEEEEEEALESEDGSEEEAVQVVRKRRRRTLR